MTPLFKKHGGAIIYLIAAIAMIVSALVLKDTEYENVWLFILIFAIAFVPVFEIYMKGDDKDEE